MVIQRIQTLYLLIAVVLTITAMFLPVGYLVMADGTAFYEFTPLCIVAEGARSFSNAPMLAMLVLSACIMLITIFNFKKLKLQIRLSCWSIVLLLVYYALFFIYMQRATAGMVADFKFNWALCLPLVALIFAVMAIRAIKHDRKLLNDANSMRLRD